MTQIRAVNETLKPREFSFSFSNFENFWEQGKRLGLRIDKGNPQNISKFENENEGKNFEDFQIILKNWPLSDYSEQGHG